MSTGAGAQDRALTYQSIRENQTNDLIEKSLKLLDTTGDVAAAALAVRLEGVIAKRQGSIYVTGEDRAGKQATLE